MKNEIKINVVITDDGTDITGTYNGKPIAVNVMQGSRLVAGILKDVAEEMLQCADRPTNINSKLINNGKNHPPTISQHEITTRKETVPHAMERAGTPMARQPLRGG